MPRAKLIDAQPIPSTRDGRAKLSDAQPVNDTPPPALQMPHPELQKVFNPKPALDKVSDTLQGLGAGALSTAHNIGKLVYPDALANRITGPEDPAKTEALLGAHNTTQKIAKGAEQTGEFLLPGAAEERGAAKLAEFAPRLGKAAAPLARIATSALSSGAVNAAQGGSPVTGAAMGAGGQVLGQGMKAAAPIIAETALGLPKAARAFGKTPGLALLNETSGIRPSTIAESAQGRLGELTPELEREAASSSTPASLLPARGIVGDAMNKAADQNAEGLFNQLGKQGDFLNYGGTSGEVSPKKLLDLKRGFNEEHLRWNPEMHDRALSTGRKAYNALDQELDRTVPQAADLNQRISSLIPVAQRAESVSRNAPTLQRAAQRFGAHTGALTLGAIGGYQGYREGGVPGAVAGSLTGVLAPELIASPEGQMALARTLNKARGLTPLVGAALQFDRKRDNQ
jgi:hypothetical protein